MNGLALLFNGLALAVGGFVYWKTASPGQNLAIRLSAALGLLAGAIVARIAEFLAEGAPWPLLLHPELGGRTILGGVIGGWIGVEVAKRRLGILQPTGDAFAFALSTGEILGRLGCYFNGCCYGKPSSLPWAIFQHGTWRHPTQLYSGAIAAVTLAILVAFRSRVRPGQLFALYLMLFSAGRLAIEPLRADFGTSWAAYLAEGASAGLLVAAVVLWRRRGLQYRAVPA